MLLGLLRTATAQCPGSLSSVAYWDGANCNVYPEGKLFSTSFAKPDQNCLIDTQSSGGAGCGTTQYSLAGENSCKACPSGKLKTVL